jgi:DNA-binding response OmpR family regulator
VSKQSVLVVAKEEVISTLLGAMVELDGFRPVFPTSDERPVDTIRRLRPALVLLDGEHDLAWDSDAMTAIRQLGVGVLLISALRSQQELELFGDRHHLPSLALPFRFRDFADRIGRLIRPQTP